MITDGEQRRAAKEFAEYWNGVGAEKSEDQKFWNDLLGKVFGVKNLKDFIEFQVPVPIQKNTGFIDARIPSTRVLIEQKGKDVDLDKPALQSGGALLTPYEQAKRYSDALKFSEKPRWIVTCNFQEFRIYDMDQKRPERKPEILRLADLPKEFYRLSFLTDCASAHIHRELQLSIQAGEIVGKLYDEIRKGYRNPDSEATLKSLNILCVRLVFCLYAEDAGIFGKKNQFQHYLGKIAHQQLRQSLIDLFKVLDTEEPRRDPYLEDELAAFPYVNGGLFENESIEIPQLSQKFQDLLFTQASEEFDWSGISPTIFGAVFESTLNPETRRSGGMHYTSLENIHKVIDPLFLDDLKAELQEIQFIKVLNTRTKRLRAFQDKLASLTFLDPACGSGNFLTETYLSLRRLENEVLKTLYKDQGLLDIEGFIKVSIAQFYGIEINDFAVTVAKTALWIAESQMLRETEEIIKKDFDFLPLKSYSNIVEANALRIDWNTVISKDKLHYIMGNPPFAGARVMNDIQKHDLETVFGAEWEKSGNLDYVCCWYKLASELMRGTEIRTALVSTNSITQGEQVDILWKPLLESGLCINFAHRTFQWNSEAKIKAQVHCVIVGFSFTPSSHPLLFDESGSPHEVKNINPYLDDAPNVFVKTSTKPLCNVPKIKIGNKPIDGGYYLFSKEEMLAFIAKEPLSEKYFKPWYGALEYINKKPRYCLWLRDCIPEEISKMPACLERVENVRKYRLSSTSSGTVKIAVKPTRFHVENMPKGHYIVIPEFSSEKRQYIPLGYMDDSVLCSNRLRLMPNASLYHFAILTSNVHMAWMRIVGGRLEMRYGYSIDIVYNNFPWPEVSEQEKAKIEATAQGILDAREKYPECTLKTLYAETTMPIELRKAHQANDKAVMAAYGFAPSLSEPEMVAELLKRYQALVSSKEAEKAPKRTRKAQKSSE